MRVARLQLAGASTSDCADTLWPRMTEPSDTVRLGEFSALRAEIQQRTSFQHALVTLNLTAVATITGFVAAQKASQQLLLILPVVSPALGLLWLDHNRTIAVIAAYVRDDLWKWKPSWEKRMSEYREGSQSWSLSFWAPVLLIFFAVSVAALVIAFPKGEAATSWVLWLAGVALSSMYLVAFVAGVFLWRDPNSLSEGSRTR